MLNEVLNTNAGDGSEQQQHYSAQHGLRDRLKQCAQLADYRENDSRCCRYSDYGRTCNLGYRHRTGHLRIGRFGRTSEESGSQTCQTITQHGAMKTRLLDEIFLCHRTHNIDIAYMFNNRCHGNRNHIKERCPLKMSDCGERHWISKPRCGNNRIKIHLFHKNCSDISGDDSTNNRNQFQQSASKGKHENSRNKCDKSKRPIRLCHINSTARKR